MAKKKYTVVRQYTDKNGNPVTAGRQIEMEESEAQPKVDSGEIKPVDE